jgi:hypothetical protein
MDHTFSALADPVRRAIVERLRRVGREYRMRFRPDPLNRIQAWITRQQAFWKAGREALDAGLAQRTGKGDRNE